MQNLALSFYKSLFTKDGGSQEKLSTLTGYPSLDVNLLRQMGEGNSGEEINRAMRSMGPLKAPMIDGFPTIFFQNNWDVVGPLVCDFLKAIWENPSRIGEVNETLIVLIGKVDKPEFITQFRPILLCNVVYKCLTKSIVNRIKPLLGDCISPYQASFVPGRNIHDNIIIAHELVHTMKRMNGRKGFMSLKIDLEKAYNWMSWSFIRDCLTEIDFPRELVNVIMECIPSPSFSLL